MLTISHTYGHGFFAPQLERLRSLGFSVPSKFSRYMGAQLCRFVRFPEGPSLELIEIENETEYDEFIPEGMVPYCPGISLNLSEGSEKGIAHYQQDFRHLRPYVLHMNYDGSLEPRKPGWNYLNFGIPVVEDTFLWLTESEEPRGAKKRAPSQPNGVSGVVGLLFNLAPEKLAELAKLVGAQIVDGAFDIGGVHIWSTDSIAGPRQTAEKRFPLIAVALQAAQLGHFQGKQEGVRETTFLSKPSIYIETNELSWDLIVTT
jgi:hypothetical protein